LSFKTRIEAESKRKRTDIVLALDFPHQTPKNRNTLLKKAENVLEAAHPYICAVKINHHLTLPLGVFDGVEALIKKIHDLNLLAVMDCKLNDIGATNQVIAEYYYEAGFDALIANPFVGWEEGLEPIFTLASRHNRGVILLTYMSHEASIQGYGQTVIDPETGEKTPQYVSFAKKALAWKADGVVVGATYPERIREIHAVVEESVPIYSPGIGAQGGAASAARKAGARYLIVGREITLAENPADVAKKIASSVKR
jgi:orotidine-5'-phosphate decarboxylase